MTEPVPIRPDGSGEQNPARPIPRQASVRDDVARVMERHELEWGLAPLSALASTSREERVRAWLADGLHGSMDWLARSIESRIRPGDHWPWARSVLVVKLPYDLPVAVAPGSRPEIAGYARGRDYHYRLDGRLKAIASDLQARFPELRTFQFCDDQHLPEVELAILAGLGWRGKNTLLLTRNGSAFHLAGLLLSLEGVDAPPPHRDHCGSCTACMAACPTGAFLEPGRIDASRCLSHWNIEDRETTENVAARSARSEIFGCDICQQACPWNRKSLTENDLPERWPASWEEWVDLCRPGGGFQSLFTKTPLRRAGRHKMLRNLLRALWNTDPARAATLARRALETETYPALLEWLRSRLESGLSSAPGDPPPTDTAPGTRTTSLTTKNDNTGSLPKGTGACKPTSV